MASTARTVAGSGYGFDIVKSDTYAHSFSEHAPALNQTLYMGKDTTIRAIKFPTHCALEIEAGALLLTLSFPDVEQLQFFVGMIDGAASDLEETTRPLCGQTAQGHRTKEAHSG